MLVTRAKGLLHTGDFTALYDKGYHTGSELKIAQDLGIEAIVAIPAVPSSSQTPNPLFNLCHFTYHPETDSYSCPRGNELITNTTWYKKKSNRNTITTFKQYKTKACKNCSERKECTRSCNGRVIERNKYTENYEVNRTNVETKQLLYKRRQAIVEHPFGTIKRQWGVNYIIIKKGKQRASADVGLMFAAYNIRRIISIVGQNNLMKYLRVLISIILVKINPSRQISGSFGIFNFLIKIFVVLYDRVLNMLIFDQKLAVRGSF